MYALRSGLIALAILVLTHTAVSARDAKSFAGRWVGHWSNSLGERGDDSLVLREDADGNISGIWTNEVHVSGQRINRNTIELTGQTSARSYQITATIEGGVMTLKYIATRLDSDGSYQGRSTFTRSR